MANVMINEEHLIAIGNAIREKREAPDETYKPREMAAAIRTVPTEITEIIQSPETNLKLPKETTEIGRYAYMGGDTGLNLTSVVAQKSDYYDYSGISIVKPFAFANQTNLKSVDLTPARYLTYLGDEQSGKVAGWGNSFVFQNCSSLETVKLPPQTAYDNTNNYLTYIGRGCFQNCTSLTDTHFITSSIRSIGPQAFENTGIETLWLPHEIYYVGCEELVNENNPNVPGGRSFAGCKNLKRVAQVISDDVHVPKYIAPDTFADCPNLTLIQVCWSEGAVPGAPWGATNATIEYNHTI